MLSLSERYYYRKVFDEVLVRNSPQYQGAMKRLLPRDDSYNFVISGHEEITNQRDETLKAQIERLTKALARRMASIIEGCIGQCAAESRIVGDLFFFEDGSKNREFNIETNPSMSVADPSGLCKGFVSCKIVFGVAKTE